MKILLADDSRAMRLVFRDVFQKLGHSSADILEAPDWPSSVAALRTDPVDLLVYDWDVHAYVDLRVDYHDEPIGELRRIYDVHRPLIPYYYGRPGNPDEFGREEEWLARQGKPYALKSQ